MSTEDPPCTISPEIVRLVADISEAVGRITSDSKAQGDHKLRRINRIRTIRGTLAIEGNTLGEGDVTALIEGKRVIAPATDLLEAVNAIKVYEQFSDWDSLSEKDLLKAHGILMKDLADDSGRYRSSGVGVVSGADVIHMAPPAGRVPGLMKNLFSWVSKTDHHPLVSSSIFHYEFEFIHPFSDGNGRIGRLWQSLLLSRWHSVFESLPVESLIFENQDDYYHAIQLSTNGADSRPFVEFSLRMILESINATPQVTPQATPQVRELLGVITGEHSRAELQSLLNLKDAKSFRARYLIPALDAGLIESTIPDKPQSPHQKYRITPLGELERG